MKTITILLIEDNTQDIRLIKEMLKEIRSFNYDLVSAATLKEGCEQIQRNNFDIILLDLNLPDSMGQQTFQKVIDCCKEIPVVLITGIEDEELSLKLIMEGAQDYIAKHSLNIAILGKAIQYSIERQTLLRNIKIQKAEIIRIEKERILLAKFPSENPGPILRVDIDGKLLYINEAGIKLLPDWQLIINEIIPSRLKDIIDSIIIKGTNIIFELDHRELIYSFYAVPLIEEGYINLYGRDITERKQTVKTLQESEERFRSLYENSTVGIYRTTPDGQILLANPTLVKLLGYSSFEELSERNLEKDGFEPSYERTYFMDVLKREGEVKGLESAWTRMDGTTLFISESARAINDKEGKIIYYDGIVEDITLRKKAEQELIISNKAFLQSEENFRRSISESPLGIRIISLEGETIYVNKAFLDIYECNSLEEFRSIPAINRYTPESYAQHQIRKEKIKNGHAIFDYEQSIIRGNAEVRYVKVWRKEIFWNGTKHYQVILTDITEQKQAEEQIKTILRTTIDGFYLVDTEGRILDTNDSYCSMIGYSREELLTMKVKDLEAAETDEVIKKRIQKILEIGFDLFETKHKRKDGSVIDIEASVNFLIEEQPKFFCFMRDITERKQAEQELIIANKAFLQSEENFRRSISESPLGIRIVSVDEKTIYANKAFLDIFEFNDIEEFTDTPALNRYTPESYVQHQERKEKRKNGHEVFDYEISIISKNAEVRYLKVWRKEVLWNGTRHYQVINLDITEHKLAEEEIQKQLDELRRWYEVTLDREGRVLELKQEVNELLKMHGEALRYESINPDVE